MNHKVWLTVFGVVAVLLVGGAGFYAASSYGEYSDAMEGWNSKVGTIESLERRVPYPNKVNAEVLEGSVKEYEKSVVDLYQSLDSFQRDLDMALASTEFQRRVKTRVQEFQEFAKTGGLAIESNEEFQLGFDAYASAIPVQELVPILDYELEAIDHLLRELVIAGADTLLTFERDLIPGEEGSTTEHLSGVVHKYPIRIRFRSDYEAFRKFVNSISNDKNFFYITRALKIQNDALLGPLKSSGGGNAGLQFQNIQTGAPATYDQLLVWGSGTASDDEVIAAAQADGYEPSDADARVLMGQEQLEVYMVVDIVRFVNPEDEGEPENERE